MKKVHWPVVLFSAVSTINISPNPVERADFVLVKAPLGPERADFYCQKPKSRVRNVGSMATIRRSAPLKWDFRDKSRCFAPFLLVLENPKAKNNAVEPSFDLMKKVHWPVVLFSVVSTINVSPNPVERADFVLVKAPLGPERADFYCQKPKSRVRNVGTIGRLTT